MIVRFLLDNWDAFSPNIRSFIKGVAVTLAVVAGQAAIRFSTEQNVDMAVLLDTSIKTGVGALGTFLLTRVSS